MAGVVTAAGWAGAEAEPLGHAEVEGSAAAHAAREEVVGLAAAGLALPASEAATVEAGCERM